MFPSSRSRPSRTDDAAAATPGRPGGRPDPLPLHVVYAATCAILVGLAFLRAYLSSTGIRITGDGLHYQRVAEGLATSFELAGRAPFVYRPLVPLLVGLCPTSSLTAFVGLTAASLLVALLLLWPATQVPRVAFVVAPLLLIDYQVLFAAANPARLDAFVLALQLGFVVLASRERRGSFFLLMVPAALVKESLVLGLLPLGLAAFAADRHRTLRLAGVSAAGFVGLHLAVRPLATVVDSAAAYQGGWLDPAAALDLLSRNLGPALPLVGLAALGGLLVPALRVMVRACRGPLGGWIAALLGVALVLPLAAATDVHRAWFELALPLTAYGLLRLLERCDRRRLAAFGGLALAAGLLPYGAVLLGTEHLYLESVRALSAGGLPPSATLVPAVLALASSVAAALLLPRGRTPGRAAGHDPASDPATAEGIIET